MDRALFLARLDAERRQAAWCGETRRAEQLRRQILQVSAGTAANPATEKTAARRPARSRT